MSLIINIDELDEHDLSYYKDAKAILNKNPKQIEFLPLTEYYNKLVYEKMYFGNYHDSCIKYIKYNKDEIYIKLLSQDITKFKHFIDPSFKVCLYAYYLDKKTLSYMDIKNKRRIKKYPYVILCYEALKINKAIYLIYAVIGFILFLIWLIYRIPNKHS